MVNFSREELLRLAKLSSIKLDESEIDNLLKQFPQTLEYIEQLEQFKSTSEHDAVKTINVFREDKMVQRDSSELLAQAPETKETYFVVPKILDQS